MLNQCDDEVKKIKNHAVKMVKLEQEFSMKRRDESSHFLKGVLLVSYQGDQGKLCNPIISIKLIE